MLPVDVRNLSSARCGCVLLLCGLEHRFYGSDLPTHSRDENESLGRQELDFPDGDYKARGAPDNRSLTLGLSMHL